MGREGQIGLCLKSQLQPIGENHRATIVQQVQHTLGIFIATRTITIELITSNLPHGTRLEDNHRPRRTGDFVQDSVSYSNVCTGSCPQTKNHSSICPIIVYERGTDSDLLREERSIA
ncbi:hypothetical protein TNCV_2004241 [Trichonephila clavipes]|nr:hypothetical protein TNCV_2004241 [Trichonephila clavipes]